MPQVPYNPVSTVSPVGATRGPISVSSPGEAFGTTVAKALEGLGRTVDRAGDEIFQRAVAIQQLNNDSMAKEADSEYMIRTGELHAQYSSKQGKERVDAFPQYMKDLERVRVEVGNKLPNQAARKIYDGSTRGTMARTIFNGAGQAASAQREFVVTTATSQMELDAKFVEDNPNDDRSFQDKLLRTAQNARLVSAAQGNPEGSVQEEAILAKATSKLWADRIAGLARTSPFEAAQKLDQIKTHLTAQDFNRVSITVRNEGRAVGAAQISDEIFTAGQATTDRPAVPLAEMEAQARERAKKLNPDDPVLANQAVAALRSRWNQHNYAVKQEKDGNLGIVNSAILKGVKDERELRLDPKVAKAIDALPESDQLSIPGRINRYNSARDKITNQDEYQRLHGLANNDVEAFLTTDLTKAQLSQGDMRTLQKLQEKIKAQPGQDPRVNKAVSWMRQAFGAQMQELDVYRRTDQNRDLYDKMTGATQAALDAWQQNKGKPPTYKEFVDSIAPEILYQRVDKGWIFNSRRGFFDQDIPKNFAEGLKQDFTAKGLPEPTAAEISRAYTRMLMNDLFAKPKTPSTPRQ